MKHIQTLETRDMAKSLLNGGCGPGYAFSFNSCSRFFIYMV